jgi:NitT/TauT family transport system substrate-binding protein
MSARLTKAAASRPPQETDMHVLRSGRTALTLGAALVLALAAGISGEAVAQTKLKMVLNWKYQGPQGFFFVAEDKGYFKAEGLDVTIDQGDGSATPIPKVASGTYESASATSTR